MKKDGQRGIAAMGLLVAIVLIIAAGAGYWLFVLKAPIPFLVKSEPVEIEEKTHGEMIAGTTTEGIGSQMAVEESSSTTEVGSKYATSSEKNLK